jgi:hypothetical protein
VSELIWSCERGRSGRLEERGAEAWLGDDDKAPGTWRMQTEELLMLSTESDEQDHMRERRGRHSTLELVTYPRKLLDAL